MAELPRPSNILLLTFLIGRRVDGFDGGYSAAELRDEVGGRYGGRGRRPLGQLERAGCVETVARRDGRIRPLLYRATDAAVRND